MIPLGEIGKWIGGGTPSKSNPHYWTNGRIPWVSPKDMKCARIADAQDHITEKAVKESSTNLIDAGSVLVVARSGILQHTLPVAITDKQVALNQDLKAVKPRTDIKPEYLFWALKTFERQILHTCTKTGTTVQSLELPLFYRFQIPLPPLPDQHRIVAEIEKQFTRLDAGVTALKRVQASLKRYRASVLKAACEGRLVPTEAELSKHNEVGRARRARRHPNGGLGETALPTNPDYETGAQLLTRILATRRQNWQGRGKYKEPATLDTTNLPPLPEGWAWATVEQLSNNVQYGLTASAIQRTSGVRFLRITDIQDRRVDWNTVPSCDASIEDIADLKLLSGDIVFARTGATVGKSFLLKAPFPESVFASYLIRISPSTDFLSTWLHIFFQSPDYWKQIHESSVGIGQPNVNGTKLQSLIVPLPPLLEQTRIVTEVERCLSIIDELEPQLVTMHSRATRLRQSILQQTVFSHEQ